MKSGRESPELFAMRPSRPQPHAGSAGGWELHGYLIPRRPITFDPRQEPGALAAHAGTCAGGAILVPTATRRAAMEDGLLKVISPLDERIRENYVNELDQSKLVDAAIKGMIGVLDSHSIYFDATTFRDMQISVSNWVGLGIEAAC